MYVLKDRHVLKRPLNLPMKRPDHNEADPKIGISSFRFSPDGLYIYSKSDTMPTVLWIWKVKSLTCLHIVLFKNQIKQFLCNVHHERLLFVNCGDTILRFIEPRVENDGIDIDPIIIPTSKFGWLLLPHLFTHYTTPPPPPIADFTVKKARWSFNGNAFLLMDTNVFCLSVS